MRGFAPISLCAVLAACTWDRGPVAERQVTEDPVAATVPAAADVAANNAVLRMRHLTVDPAAMVSDGFEVVEEADPTVSAIPDPSVLEAHAGMIRGGGFYKVGAPYEIAGKLYEPQEDVTYDRTGMASWYGGYFHGRLTANGEIFDSAAISAAHPTLPLPSYVRVTNLRNNRSIIVRVNDRGPYVHDRLIDVSEQTAELLGFHRKGLTEVRVEYVSRAPLGGEDKATLLASYREGDGEPSAILASARLLPADVLAFSTERPPRQAQAAIEEIIASLPAAERIGTAFQVAAEAEE